MEKVIQTDNLNKVKNLTPRTVVHRVMRANLARQEKNLVQVSVNERKEQITEIIQRKYQQNLATDAV